MTDPVDLPPLLVSAYAASPAYTRWDPDLEAGLLTGLRALPGVVGFEVPWRGAVHPHDPDWFIRNLPVGSVLTVTGLPHVMGRCAADAGYGIASTDEAGRRDAVADLRAQAADVHRLHAETDARVVAVLLHTAPRGGGSSAALTRSLRDLAAEDWSGAELIVEHCDAAVPGQAWEKGFLSVDDELAAIARSGTATGVWLNWGRSAIELRDAGAVTRQIAAVAETRLLRGLAFSGAAAVDGPYGGAWVDAHLPTADADPEARSLLGSAEIAAAAAAAGAVPWLGLKVSRRPADRSAADVVATVAANLAAVRSAYGSARAA